MARIHHMTAKQAKKVGITLEIDENEVVASKDGVQLASHMSASVALAEAVKKLGGASDTVAALKEDAAAKAPIPTPKRASKATRKEVARINEMAAEDDEEGDEADLEEGEDDEEEGKEIVKKKYKERYRPHHMTCGDELARLITEHVSKANEDGDVRIDKAKLRSFAKANDCWVPTYAHLNVGMQRMNIANRLRAKIKKGHEVVWG